MAAQRPIDATTLSQAASQPAFTNQTHFHRSDPLLRAHPKSPIGPPGTPQKRFTKRTHLYPLPPRDLSYFQQDTPLFCHPPAATTNPFSAILSSQEGSPCVPFPFV